MMPDAIPEDVRELVRSLFAAANLDVSRALSEPPAIHEETLDQLLVLGLNRSGPQILPASGAALVIDTHWLGGRRFYLGRWEIADIALVAILRRLGQMVWRKVALLQSKRLYSNEISVAELERFDYEVGIGRLIDTAAPQAPLVRPRRFSFTCKSRYGALSSDDDQVGHIEEYSRARSMPVYYSLYNPLTIPFEGVVPSLSARVVPPNEVGCRVLTSAEVHQALRETNGSPTFDELKRPGKPPANDNWANHGWRLEGFVADEFLACREGRRFEDAEHPDLSALMYARSAPISAAIVLTIDLPGPQPTMG
jgi:hypothetical protein